MSTPRGASGKLSGMEEIAPGITGGMSVEEVVEEYELSREAVLAALAYASRMLASEEVRAIA